MVAIRCFAPSALCRAWVGGVVLSTRAGLGRKDFGVRVEAQRALICRRSLSEERDQPCLFSVRRHQRSIVVLLCHQPGKAGGGCSAWRVPWWAHFSSLSFCLACFGAGMPHRRLFSAVNSAAPRNSTSASQLWSVTRCTSSSVAQRCPCAVGVCGGTGYLLLPRAWILISSWSCCSWVYLLGSVGFVGRNLRKIYTNGSDVGFKAYFGHM